MFKTSWGGLSQLGSIPHLRDLVEASGSSASHHWAPQAACGGPGKLWCLPFPATPPVGETTLLFPPPQQTSLCAHWLSQGVLTKERRSWWLGLSALMGLPGVRVPETQTRALSTEHLACCGQDNENPPPHPQRRLSSVRPIAGLPAQASACPSGTELLGPVLAPGGGIRGVPACHQC